ncbi:hypothetical protein rsdtw13_38890 [Clostridium sp. TW13]|uniref:Uncharacterized protein n=1 Tax=Inconstantimicrobium mannanitabidum TaxID=1604901 RepID=A0ACB5RHS4_9CLOT|nr:hypothetical protein rsdtw13_38890 [Clostridium sp. TW13]
MSGKHKVKYNFLSNPTGKEIEEFMKTDGEIKEAMGVLYNK